MADTTLSQATDQPFTVEVGGVPLEIMHLRLSDLGSFEDWRRRRDKLAYNAIKDELDPMERQAMLGVLIAPLTCQDIITELSNPQAAAYLLWLARKRVDPRAKHDDIEALVGSGITAWVGAATAVAQCIGAEPDGISERGIEGVPAPAPFPSAS